MQIHRSANAPDGGGDVRVTCAYGACSFAVAVSRVVPAGKLRDDSGRVTSPKWHSDSRNYWIQNASAKEIAHQCSFSASFFPAANLSTGAFFLENHSGTNPTACAHRCRYQVGHGSHKTVHNSRLNHCRKRAQGMACQRLHYTKLNCLYCTCTGSWLILLRTEPGTVICKTSPGLSTPIACARLSRCPCLARPYESPVVLPARVSPFLFHFGPFFSPCGQAFWPLLRFTFFSFPVRIAGKRSHLGGPWWFSKHEVSSSVFFFTPFWPPKPTSPYEIVGGRRAPFRIQISIFDAVCLGLFAGPRLCSCFWRARVAGGNSQGQIAWPLSMLMDQSISENPLPPDCFTNG